jgi:hypothetical protein
MTKDEVSAAADRMTFYKAVINIIKEIGGWKKVRKRIWLKSGNS